jgi:NAD+ synthase
MNRTSWAEETAEQLSRWISAEVNRAGLDGVVVGLSGGVDSAVVGGLAKRAFPDSALAVIMPCHSEPEDAELAREVAASFGISVVAISLDRVFDSFQRLLSADEQTLTGERIGAAALSSRRRLATANIKPRLRMITLYYYANLTHRLVLGTDNKTELELGYFTKYGDGGVDLLPIGSLVKKEVYALAEYLGVPEKVIQRPPSAGLWPGQTDEAEIGLSYEVLDSYLRGGEVAASAAARIAQMKATTAHKRVPPPVAPAAELECTDN